MKLDYKINWVFLILTHNNPLHMAGICEDKGTLL
jgi:hypothetical protein